MIAVAVFTLVGCGAASAGREAQPGDARPSGAVGKGQALQPTDFPQAPQSLVFRGQISALVSVGRPSSCGSGSGPNGPVVFGYGVYFQAGDQWFLFNVITDGTANAYKGPGAYRSHAWLRTVGSERPATPGYLGDITLTVTKDTMPDAGTVDGELPDDAGHLVSVSGGWTCQWGPQLGPG